MAGLKEFAEVVQRLSATVAAIFELKGLKAPVEPGQTALYLSSLIVETYHASIVLESFVNQHPSHPCGTAVREVIRDLMKTKLFYSELEGLSARSYFLDIRDVRHSAALVFLGLLSLTSPTHEFDPLIHSALSMGPHKLRSPSGRNWRLDTYEGSSMLSDGCCLCVYSWSIWLKEARKSFLHRELLAVTLWPHRSSEATKH